MKKEEVIIFQTMKQITTAKTAGEQFELVKHAVKLAYEAGARAERERCTKIVESFKPRLDNLSDIDMAKARTHTSVYDAVIAKITSGGSA